MTRLRTIFVALGALLMMGCTAQYSKSLLKETLQDAYLINTPEINSARQWVLPRKSTFYVAFPEGSWSVPLRRKMTADLAQAMNNVFINVAHGDDPVSLVQALQLARRTQKHFVIYPQLAVYSNKLSSLVEIDEDFEDYRQIGFDRLVLLLKLYDTASQSLVDVTQIRARSSLLAVERATPSSLFNESFLAYADSLVLKPVK